MLSTVIYKKIFSLMFDMTACLHALNTNNEVVRIIVESLCNLSKIHVFFVLFFKLSVVNKKLSEFF